MINYIPTFENFLNEGKIDTFTIMVESFIYKDAEGLERVYVYRIEDKNQDDYVAIIDYDGEVDIYDEELTKSEENEIKKYAKSIKSKGAQLKKEAQERWIGWFVVTKPLNGDLNHWKVGELIKAEKGEDSGYIFIQTADPTVEAYDDIEEAVFKNRTIALDPKIHKTQLKYLEKIDKMGYLNPWESYK
jgi:hypothetical protein